ALELRILLHHHRDGAVSAHHVVYQPERSLLGRGQRNKRHREDNRSAQRQQRKDFLFQLRVGLFVTSRFGRNLSIAGRAVLDRGIVPGLLLVGGNLVHRSVVNLRLVLVLLVFRQGLVLGGIEFAHASPLSVSASLTPGSLAARVGITVRLRVRGNVTRKNPFSYEAVASSVSTVNGSRTSAANGPYPMRATWYMRWSQLNGSGRVPSMVRTSSSITTSMSCPCIPAISTTTSSASCVSKTSTGGCHTRRPRSPTPLPEIIAWYSGSMRACRRVCGRGRIRLITIIESPRSCRCVTPGRSCPRQLSPRSTWVVYSDMHKPATYRVILPRWKYCSRSGPNDQEQIGRAHV